MTQTTMTHDTVTQATVTQATVTQATVTQATVTKGTLAAPAPAGAARPVRQHQAATPGALALVGEAASPVRNPGVEALRAVAALDAETVPWTASQVKTVVEGLTGISTLDEIASAAGLPPAAVVDAVAELGTWLTHVHGNSGVEAVVKITEVDARPMLQYVPAPAGRGKQKTAPANKRGRGRKAQPITVFVPEGFEPAAAGRDVRRSIGAIVAAQPDAAAITRYLARQYHESRQELTFDHVTVTWKFAQLGRLDDIDKVNPANRELSRLLVEAYDLLEVARRDAMGGLVELLSSGDDFDRTDAAAAKIRPLFEAEAARFASLAAMAKTNVAAERKLAKDVKFLASRIEANPSTFCVATIAELNDGQVRRIAQAGGLTVASSNRAESMRIRAGLTELGLGADADQLIPVGLRAVERGAEEAFWAACERRADGDPGWASGLAGTLES